MQNPFTTTFSKIPDDTYIPTDQITEILENFQYDRPSESVYKITGVRGSGKTVLLGKVERELSSDLWKDRGYIVYRLAPARDMLSQLASLLYRDGYMPTDSKNRSISLSFNVLGTGGGIGFEKEGQDHLDTGIALETALNKATVSGKRIVIGIDEVSRTPEMIEFASEFGKWLRSDLAVYLVCTGLYENIEQLYNVKNLTFFRRATTIKTEPLSEIRMSEMYRSRLNIDIQTAREYAGLTRGYPYAFQELGIQLFKNRDSSKEEIIQRLKAELFAYSYEKIWEELSKEDRDLVRILAHKEESKREDIIRFMDKPNNYSVYRDRLMKRGIITTRYAFVSLALPFFDEYVNEYWQ